MDRLVFNTPTRWADGSQTKFIAFILFFLTFLVVIFLGFLIWFLAYPDSRQRLIAQIDSQLTPGVTPQEQREYEFLFGPESRPNP